MKKKKKVKKKRRSTAWKDLEKYTAKFLDGTRILRGANFSASLPDVVADGGVLGFKDTTVLVECKHSQNQPFVDLLKDDLDGLGYMTDKELGTIVFWKFEDTKALVNLSECSNSLSKAKKIEKDSVPQYIRDHYHQACGYQIIGLVPIGHKILRIVVMAKKSSATRIAYTTLHQFTSLGIECLQLL